MSLNVQSECRVERQRGSVLAGVERRSVTGLGQRTTDREQRVCGGRSGVCTEETIKTPEQEQQRFQFSIFMEGREERLSGNWAKCRVKECREEL